MRFEFNLVSTLRRVGSPSSELRRDRVGHTHMVDWLWQWDVNVITVRSLSNLWMMGGNGKQVRGCLYMRVPFCRSVTAFFYILMEAIGQYTRYTYVNMVRRTNSNPPPPPPPPPPICYVLRPPPPPHTPPLHLRTYTTPSTVYTVTTSHILLLLCSSPPTAIRYSSIRA